ncbi:MAG: ribosomal RNA small subunit methyltransferase A [Acidobacteria bacterium]|nr:ribosomal RNA small subunit methyltransferase A [Acidobacteriota bacterium]
MARSISSAPSSKTGAPLGQHFLVDRRIEQRIFEAVRPTSRSVVLEIGGGPGNMTRLLAERAARVVSVEIDRKLAAKLEEQFADDFRVEILTGDILKVPIDEIAQRYGVARLLVFGNLPYYITSPILMRLFANMQVIDRIVVMMQYEVAMRIIATPGTSEYGLLSVTCQYYTEPKLLFPIPAHAFNPPPKVVSALVSMPVCPQKLSLGIQDEADFWLWMRAAFAQKRKTLVNNWKTLAPAPVIMAAIGKEGFDSRIRAEDLSLRELAILYRNTSHTIHHQG